ncbi:hypothetical protein BT69DRAFT_1288035 [Atractiella rhizophila]|nr:hypothetical protein BT69DRAFT_1288035 [Atractiella rhizophila]
MVATMEPVTDIEQLDIPLDEEEELFREIDECFPAGDSTESESREEEGKEVVEFTDWKEKEDPRPSNPATLQEIGVLVDESILTSRVLLTVEGCNLSRQPRRTPTEICLRLALQDGIWLRVSSFSLSLYVQPTGLAMAGRPGTSGGARMLDSKVEIGRFLPTPPAPTPTSYKSPRIAHTFVRDEDSTKLSVRRDGRCARLEWEEMSEEDERPSSLPIYLSCRHTADFILHFRLSLTFSLSADALSSLSPSLRSSRLRKSYASSLFFDRKEVDEMETAFGDWSEMEKEVNEELKGAEWSVVEEGELPVIPELVIGGKEKKLEER